MPKATPLKFAAVNGAVQSEVTEDGGNRVYHWVADNRPRPPQDDNLPSKVPGERLSRECRGATIVCIAMATYRELLKQVKDRIEEVDAREAQDILGAAWIDVREQDEWDEGHIPGAVHVPRGNLESRIESVVADRTKPIVIYCASGNRSAFAAETLALSRRTLAGGEGFFFEKKQTLRSKLR